jgi:hypothetical protein
VRTYVYVDGFNLYYGSVKGTPYKWLNIVELCRRLMPENEIERVHYFTARVKSPRDDPTKNARQQAFIRALETLPEIQVTYGSFLANTKKMPLAPPRRPSDRDPGVVSLQPGGPTAAIVTHMEEKGSDVQPCGSTRVGRLQAALPGRRCAVSRLRPRARDRDGRS